jgi:hypothetical protein
MTQPDIPRSRRAVLATAVGAAAATAAATLSRPLAVSAATGDPLILGQENAASDATQLNGRLSVTTTDDFLAPAAITVHSDDAPAFNAISDHHIAVRGVGLDHESTGVEGRATNVEGTGVLAVNDEEGFGLFVHGKVGLGSRSGRASILAGRSYVDFDLRSKGGLTGTPLCFATLRSYRPGVYVAAVRANYPSSGKARIYLNKAVSSTTNVSWFVLN